MVMGKKSGRRLFSIILDSGGEGVACSLLKSKCRLCVDGKCTQECLKYSAQARLRLLHKIQKGDKTILVYEVGNDALFRGIATGHGLWLCLLEEGCLEKAASYGTVWKVTHHSKWKSLFVATLSPETRSVLFFYYLDNEKVTVERLVRILLSGETIFRRQPIKYYIDVYCGSNHPFYWEFLNAIGQFRDVPPPYAFVSDDIYESVLSGHLNRALAALRRVCKERGWR